jgi:hypothetical protein
MKKVVVAVGYKEKMKKEEVVVMMMMLKLVKMEFNNLLNFNN